MNSNDISAENPAHCRQILQPWVVTSMPSSRIQWKWELLLDYLHWRGKIIKKQIKSSLISGSKSVAKYRTSDHVKSTYGRTWSSVDWPHPHTPKSRKDRTLADWENEGLVLTKAGLNQMQLERIMRVIELTKPRTVLEVGAGTGINLLTLAACFPDIQFAGLELTQEGVDRARSVQEEDELPDIIASFSPYEIKDSKAHKKIDFTQGNATNMPFEDNSYDLVYSRLALEQMELVRDEAIAEIVRVSKQAVLMVEPFADFNQDSHRSLAHRAKNYFSLSTSDVQKYGLELMAVFSNWPQKISEGTGLAYYHLK